MTSWIWGSSQFDEQVDKATSELLPTDQEDIALNLEICDQIKSKDVQPKDAMRALKRRLNHKNPNVQLLALTLTDVCVKNGGNHFLVEVSSREFMDNMVSILKIPALNNDVKNRMLRFIQNWAMAFEGKPEFAYVNTVYKTLVSEGFKFPPKDLINANNAMTDTAIAPEWIDSDVCLRCRDPFTFTNRKHHCRNCGLVFDQKCSSKSLPLPHFGITQDVRVCDSCHFKLTRKKEQAAKEAEDAKKKQQQQQRSEHSSHIDYDLARAIELSLKESQGSTSGRAGYAPLSDVPKQWHASEPPLVDRSTAKGEEEDEELRAAIEASLRESRAPQPSAPVEEPTHQTYESPVATVPSYDLAPLESDAIMSFNQTVADAQTYGMQDMRRTHELYSRAASYQPKLTRSLDDTQRKEQILSDMHDKLSQAVKLYDNLLTEQFSARRQATPTQSSYAQYSAYNQQQQWAPSAPYSAGYTPAPMNNVPVPDQRWVTPAPTAIPQQYSTQQVVPSSPPQHTHTQPVSAPPQMNQFQMQQQEYGTTLPPVTLPQFSTPQPPVAVSPAPAPAPIPTPAPVPSQPQPALSRHNTVQSYHPHAAQVHRSNTVASSPYQAQQPQVQYTPQPLAHQVPHQQATPAPLPVMPTAPTNAPSSYSLFAQPTTLPSIPAAPKAEPKEAMLISFD
ncbi:Vacuolar protein sorting-associated protein 27 [Serendipita indica DSM 11827]|nr:Vacuolar protein sorting-associated protein 27 [Serendipita indica DSM 11827]